MNHLEIEGFNLNIFFICIKRGIYLLNRLTCLVGSNDKHYLISLQLTSDDFENLMVHLFSFLFKDKN